MLTQEHTTIFFVFSFVTHSLTTSGGQADPDIIPIENIHSNNI